MEKDFLSLRDAKHIWIYGAGIVGKRVWNALSQDEIGLKIEGMVVSEKKGQDSNDECRVVEIGDIKTADSDTIFIIGVSAKYQEEVINTLSAHGYNNYVIWKNKFYTERWYLSGYKFEDRKKNLSKVCIVLSGYKEFLWDIVFERLEHFVPDDVEVCILSSGLYSERLSDIAEKAGWSYFSTKVNDLTLVQNMVIRLYEQAEWIYKMDEDIFLTEGCFEKLMQAQINVEKNEPYRIGFVAPLIPVNGYGHIRLLDYLGKRQRYEQLFERVYYGCYPESMLEKNIAAAQYMWGLGGEIPQLDELNSMFSEEWKYSVCGVRFSIGFILLHRSIWKAMNEFPVTGGIDLGADEVDLCKYCIVYSKAMIVAENTVVGHFSFKQQASDMREFYEKNQELFRIRQENKQ